MNRIEHKRIEKIWIWICFLLAAGTHSFQEMEENFFDFDSMPAEYFKLENGEPIFLNESHCLDEISASVVSGNAHGNPNKSLYYMQIRWSSKHFMMSIQVESDSLNDSYCEARNKHYYIRKPLNQSVHVFPDDVNEGIRFLPIKLDCKYTITPELDGICRPTKFRFATPVCISDESCTCRNVFIPPPKLQANMEKHGVNVLWSHPKNFDENSAKIVFTIYQEDGINSRKIERRKLTAENVGLLAGKNRKEYFELNTTTGNGYRIQSYFENKINCRGNSTFLQIPNPEEIQRGKNQPFTTTSIFLFVLIFVGLLFFWKKQIKRSCMKFYRSESEEMFEVEFRSENLRRKNFQLPQMIHNSNYMDQSSDSYWFDYRDLVISKEIGNGNFGVVYLATSSKHIRGCNKFAVKQIKDTAGDEEVANFAEEINTFKLVGSHPNVVKMLGYCGSPHPLTIIMEYVPFNLLKYLKNLRLKFEKRKSAIHSIKCTHLSHSSSCSTIDNDYISQSEVESAPFADTTENELSIDREIEIDYVLSNRDLEIFGLQIARGMSHLESRAIVHRDLAARNVLMDSFKNLKISDFGMSRTGIYVNKTTKKFPLRWMSPEALINRTYSNKSDVWAFGVVLWEIGTLGAFPYSSLQNEEVISFLEKGGHLDKPENVTENLYRLMVDCWANSAEARPTFKELVEKLEKFCHADNGYVDFGNLKSNYVFPPMEEEVNKQ